MVKNSLITGKHVQAIFNILGNILLETLFEALPQSVLNVIFFINELSEDDFKFNNYSIQVECRSISFID